MIKYIKNNYKKIIALTIIFVFFVFLGLFVNELTGDEIWNYGFAHNIYKGLIPYKDFNMVITPLFPFLMSLPFHIFGSSMLVFNMEQALILTTMIYIVYKQIKEKAWLIAFLFIFPYFSIVFPSYNIFMLFICIILIVLEEKKTNDYIIGIVLALGVLTKQSVGVCLILPTLMYLKQPKKILKRFLGFLIPIGIFFIYLICSKSLNGFIDLCFLGLFDFSNKNGQYLTINTILVIGMLIILMIMLKKYPKNISNYYTIAFLSMAVPLFDSYHTHLAFIMLSFNYLKLSKHKPIINIRMFSIATIVILSILNTRKAFNRSHIYPNNLKHFEYRMVDDENVEFLYEITDYINSNKDKEMYFLEMYSYFIKLTNDIKIGWLDLVNDGNWGYNGEEKMLKAIKNKKDALYIIDKEEIKDGYQTNSKILKYIIKHGKKIDSIRMYDVYTFE